MRLLKAWWYGRLRSIDMEILWPVCCDKAKSLDEAKAAFAMHALHDPAWMFLGQSEVFSLIDNLQTAGEIER